MPQATQIGVLTEAGRDYCLRKKELRSKDIKNLITVLACDPKDEKTWRETRKANLINVLHRLLKDGKIAIFGEKDALSKEIGLQAKLVDRKLDEETKAGITMDIEDDTEETGTQVDIDAEKKMSDSKQGNEDSRNRVCRFYKRGHCKFGKSGKNKEGKCPYEHPATCKLFDMKGWHRFGCKNRRCRQLHRDCCRTWMDRGVCSRKEEGTECRFYHPWGCEKRLEEKEEKSLLNKREIFQMIRETIQLTLQQWGPPPQHILQGPPIGQHISTTGAVPVTPTQG